MMIHPALMLDLVHDQQRDLVAEADRARLLRSARRWSRVARATKPTPRTAPRMAPRPARQPVEISVAASRADGNVTTCVPRAAAPAGR